MSSISFEYLGDKLILCYAPAMSIEDIKKRLSSDEAVALTTISASSAISGASSSKTRSIKPSSPSKCSAPAGTARPWIGYCRRWVSNLFNMLDSFARRV